jgi:guanine deaminase
MTKLAIRADLLDFTADPGWAAPNERSPGLRWRPEHWLLIDQGRIVGVQAQTPDASWPLQDRRGHLLMPGFIDTHVHMPQLEVIASFGTELLHWLETYTFPAELRYADPAVCAHSSGRFLDALLAHGTTAAVVFPTVHKASAEALFAAAEQRGMRVIAGKCLMDRNAPPGLTDTLESAERDSIELIGRWHGRARGAYAHTDVAENQDELRWVAELFPAARSYLDVYARHGLIGPRSVLAHGIWLDAEDRALLGREGGQIAHSPSSNLFLGSGLMDWRGLEASGVAVSLARDVGGGTSLSMWRTMADAYKVQALRGQRLSAWKAIHAATRGAAVALGLEGEIGSFDVGCMADLALWQYAVGPVATVRDVASASLHERVFALMTLGDERNLVASYVAGRCMVGETPSTRSAQT